MATRLQATGERVALLALLDAYPWHEAAGPEPDRSERADLLGDLLESLGCPSDGESKQPVDYAEFIRRARAADSAVAGLDEIQVAAMAEVFRANVSLARSFEPTVFDGHVLLFAASPGGAPVQIPSSDDWAPHVRGRLEVRRITCTHGEMLGPGPMSEIGPVLAAYLSSLTAADPL